MNNQRRQLIVGVVGASVAFAGLVFQLAILDKRAIDPIRRITNLGDMTQGWGGPVWETKMKVLGQIGMGLFYSGLLLMVAAVLAWLLVPENKSNDNDAA